MKLPFAYAHERVLVCRKPIINTAAYCMFTEIVILAILSLIIVSLFSGMFFLLRDRGQSTRMVKALTVRIVLSLVLFALLMIGYWAGWLHPHGLLPPRH